MWKKIMTAISVLVMWSGFFISPVAVLAGGGMSETGQQTTLVGEEGTQLLISDITLRAATSGGLVETNLLAAIEPANEIGTRAGWLGIGLEIILIGSAVWLFWRKKINFMSMVLVAIATSWLVAFIFWLTLINFWWPIIIVWILNSSLVVLALWHNSRK